MAQTIQCRRRYLESGIEWQGAASGGSSRAWKADQRLREAMEAAGQNSLTKTESNLPLVKLNPHAETVSKKLMQPVDMTFGFDLNAGGVQNRSLVFELGLK
ncbi:MAG: hypothetical protein P8J33_07435 [Pirellulaceae bacterium]|nr:hypothetical protein [Pirellulaceae bacterium]